MTPASETASPPVPEGSCTLTVGVDVGGTFTDVFVLDESAGTVTVAKVPTTRPDQSIGFLDGIARAVERLADIAVVVHGTTVGTNALLERKGARSGVITTAGLRDVLAMRRRDRPRTWGLRGRFEPVVDRRHRLEVPERTLADGSIRTPVDLEAVRAAARELLAAGCESVSVLFANAYANPENEMRAAAAVRALWPNPHVAASSEILPEIREFERFSTTALNAYLQPEVSGYLHRLEASLRGGGFGGEFMIVQSNGGVMGVETACRLPVRTALSGPAAGVIAAGYIAGCAGFDNVVTGDMGGTSFDVSLIADGRTMLGPETAIDFGLVVRTPMIEIATIGAGGGSIARVDAGGLLAIGPESAGSEPGPVAFGRGGTAPTVSDADVTLGYLRPEGFAEGQLALDVAAATEAIGGEIGAALELDAIAAADGVSRIVDESMASAARMHAVESGKDLGARTMIAFGGNGPLHACRVARSAGVRRVLVPPEPGVGSALGFLHAPVSFERVRSRHTRLRELDAGAVNTLLEAMEAEARGVVRQGAPDGELRVARTAFMRYSGQGHEIDIALPGRTLGAEDRETLIDAFERAYARQFSRPVPGMDIEILNWAVRVSAPASVVADPITARLVDDAAGGSGAEPPSRRRDWRETREIVCDVSGERVAAVFVPRDALVPGDRLSGPALIAEPQTTTFVGSDFGARVDTHGNLVLTRLEPSTAVRGR